MKRLAVIFIFILSIDILANDLISNQFPSVQPFGNLKKIVVNTGWGVNATRQARLIHDERKRLDDIFEPELLKFLKNDIDGLYWTGIFLSNESYLFENSPNNELALKLFDKGIELCLKESDDSVQKGRLTSLATYAAIISIKMGKSRKAHEFKSISEKYKKLFFGSFPILDDIELKLYNSIQ
jgi:hypothetical protein